MGRVGFLYESVKDQLKWSSLSQKSYTKMMCSVGQIMALSDDDYKKEKAKSMKMSASSIAAALESVFGDGK